MHFAVYLKAGAFLGVYQKGDEYIMQQIVGSLNVSFLYGSYSKGVEWIMQFIGRLMHSKEYIRKELNKWCSKLLESLKLVFCMDPKAVKEIVRRLLEGLKKGIAWSKFKMQRTNQAVVIGNRKEIHLDHKCNSYAG